MQKRQNGLANGRTQLITVSLEHCALNCQTRYGADCRDGLGRDRSTVGEAMCVLGLHVRLETDSGVTSEKHWRKARKDAD